MDLSRIWNKLIRYSNDIGVDVYVGKCRDLSYMCDGMFRVDIKQRKSLKNMIYILAHELGHILWFKNLKKHLKDKFFIYRNKSSEQLEDEFQAWGCAEQILYEVWPQYYGPSYYRLKQRYLKTYYRQNNS
jgi:hypothetical protein